MIVQVWELPQAIPRLAVVQWSAFLTQNSLKFIFRSFNFELRTVSLVKCASFWIFVFLCACGFIMREIVPFHYLRFPGVMLMEPVIVSIKTYIGSQVNC